MGLDPVFLARFFPPSAASSQADQIIRVLSLLPLTIRMSAAEI